MYQYINCVLSDKNKVSFLTLFKIKNGTCPTKIFMHELYFIFRKTSNFQEIMIHHWMFLHW